MVDYRKFLGDTHLEVLPYLGGPVADSLTRRLRVTATDIEPGWWRFEISGRDATPIERVESPDLSGLASVSGHVTDNYLFAAGGVAERFAIGPDDEPARFAAVCGRRWPGGELVFDSLVFESDAEEQARRAFEDGATLDGMPGIPSSLRAAFGFAVLRRQAAVRDTYVVAAETTADLGRVADRGTAFANEVVDRIVHERAVRRALAQVHQPNPRRRRGTADGDPVERAAEALAGAGAALLAARRLDNDTLEVRYRFLGERWESIVDADTLQVYDAGICLDGADRELTLESLPAVIREAHATGLVHVTRYVG